MLIGGKVADSTAALPAPRPLALVGGVLAEPPATHLTALVGVGLAETPTTRLLTLVRGILTEPPATRSSVSLASQPSKSTGLNSARAA
jgi:hypothetical protein